MKVKYDAKLLIKLSLIFFGLLFFVCIMLGRRTMKKEAPEGERITRRDVTLLLDALDTGLKLSEDAQRTDDSFLTYDEYMEICRALGNESFELPDYADRYEPAHEMLKADWYQAFQIMLAYLDTEASLWETTIFLLSIDVEVDTAYTESGLPQTPYRYESPEFEENVLREMRVYVKGDRLLTVVEVCSGEHTLENVWVTEETESGMECFYRNILFQTKGTRTVGRECVADLTFRDGMVTGARAKKEKVHGKLLWASKEELEIEGSGVYPIAEGMEAYKLYGSLETLGRTDLKIGYADTDYVIEKGKVCACLVSEKEAADRIRVLLKNTAKNSNYYDAVELVVDSETVRIAAHDLEVGERRSFRCAALTDKIQLNIDGIKKEDNAYRGTIECYRNAGGMMLINELPLEEYLYAVVPSEMPASYPMEALKAQAVCARTYAYLYILHAGLPEAGAHVDDTTSYQVYHNCSENAATTTAVKETDGVLLTYQGEPARNYYYSTSCGVGTDAGIWKMGGENDIPYINALPLCASVEDAGIADTLREEENFRAFITSVGETDLEREEPWYRWTYTVEDIGIEAMSGRMTERYAGNPEAVLTKTEGGYFVSQPIGTFSRLRKITITRRGAGGVAEELLIVSDAGTYKVLGEYNIRSVLCDRAGVATRQDGSTQIPASILPSGFFVIETGKKGDNVVGYTLIGGGYGHGVGMSQNGARALGRDGASYRQILEFFFRGCQLDRIGKDSD